MAVGVAGEPEVGVLQRQATLRGILRRQPPPALRAMLREKIAWVPQPSAVVDASVTSPQRDSHAWLRRASDLPEHELQQRRQVRHFCWFFPLCLCTARLHYAVMPPGGAPHRLCCKWVAVGPSQRIYCTRNRQQTRQANVHLFGTTDRYTMHRCNRLIPRSCSCQQVVEAACVGEPELCSRVAKSGAFDVELVDTVRLHLGF